jgi:hypothetical protein
MGASDRAPDRMSSELPTGAGHGTFVRLASTPIDSTCGVRAMKPDEETIARYLERASELRELAGQETNPEICAVLINAAEAYERLARWDPTKKV